MRVRRKGAQEDVPREASAGAEIAPPDVALTTERVNTKSDRDRDALDTATTASAGAASPTALAKLALLVASGKLDLDLLKEDVQRQIAPLLDAGPPGSDSWQRVEAVHAAALEALGPGPVRQAIEELAEVANAGALALLDPLDRETMEAHDAGRGDLRDWNREWGFALISRDHPRFRSGKHLVGWNQEAGQNRSHFMFRSSPTRAKERFEKLFRQLCPRLSSIAYSGSGTDAVNRAFDVARRAGLVRLGLAQGGTASSEVRPMMAYLDGCYGGAHGDALALNWEHFARNAWLDVSRYRLSSPLTTSLEPTDPAEIARLEPIEREALEHLRRMAADTAHPIGAIFIEPIPAARGVFCYRKVFMQQLRALADELNLPIIADEVLTCGGRTGKFFAYELYGDFEPDYVAFGKGLQVNGLAQVRRRAVQVAGADGEAPWHSPQGPAQTVDLLDRTTGGGSPGDFYKAAEVLSIIQDEHLIERAEVVGERLRAILAKVQATAGVEADLSVFGCLAGWKPPPNSTRGAIADTDGGRRRRLMPPLDLPIDELDRIERDFIKAATA